MKSKYRNSEMQSLRYEENRKAVSQRRQEQSSATLYRKMLISWSSGSRILILLYQIKGKEISFIVKSKYQNSEMQFLRYEESRKALSQRRQEQSSTTLYRKIVKPW